MPRSGRRARSRADSPCRLASCPARSRRTSGATSHNITTRRRRSSGRRCAGRAAVSARAMPTTSASRHHAVTSSTAAQVERDHAHAAFVRSRRSVRMRASTGNAVTDERRADEQREHGERHARRTRAADRAQSESAAPSTKGTTMLACEMATVAAAARLHTRQVELEPDQEHVQDDAELRVHAEKRSDLGRQQPREQRRARSRREPTGRAGCPPMTSPITAGWPIARKTSPRAWR